MIQKFVAFTLAVWLADAGLPRLAGAQTLDQLGNRASALGAFVAVADDASAVAWNPAGLVNGPIFNILLDFGQVTTEPDADPRTSTRPAGRSGGTFLAAGVPPFGISYYRMRKTELNPAAESGSSREDEQLAVRSLVTSHLGVTVLQSLADGLTIGATVKLVRGSLTAGSIPAESWEAGFEQAETLEGTAETKADVDAGALLARGRFRVGVVARNLAAPRFEAGASNTGVTIERHARAGVAWGNGWPGNATLILALDADLTRVRHLARDRRDVAAGAERWFRGQKFAVRGGLRASTVDEARPIASAGGSIAVRQGTYVDFYAARGREHDRAWGVTARLMF